jgi:WD40 repeat protein
MHVTLHAQKVTPIFQTGHFSKVTKVDFHPNNEHLISAGDDGKIIVWDINLGLQRAEVLAHQYGVLDFDILNEHVMISLGQNNVFKTWTFPELELINSFRIDEDSLQAFTILSASKLCVVGKTLHFYDFTDGKLINTEYQSKGLFSSVDFHPIRNEIIVTGPKDNYAVAIDIKDPIYFKQYYLGNIHRAKYADSLVLLASTSGWLKYHNINSDKSNMHGLFNDLNYISDMDGYKSSVALGTAFGFTTIINATDYKVITTVGLNGVPISAVSYSKDGKWLATANTQGSIYIYDAEQYRINNILKGASANITDVKVFDNSLVVGFANGIIRYIDLPNNLIKSNSVKLDQIQEQNGINYAILGIDTMIDGKVLFEVLETDRHHIKTSLITSAKRMTASWELKTNQIVLTQNANNDSFDALVRNNFKKNKPFQLADYTEKTSQFIFDNFNYLINDKSFNFSNLDSKIDYDTKHSAPIMGLRYIPKFRLILSYSDDGSIRFWKPNGQYLAVLYLSGQYSFFYQNENNFYFAAKEILNKIGFVFNGKLFSYEQYDIYYNRPAEVMKILPFFKAEDISDYQKAYFKRLQKLGILVNELVVSNNLPKIEVAYFDDYSTKKQAVNFTISMAALEGKIVRYSYLINGIEKQFELTEPAVSYSTEVEISLASGINQIEFYCIDDSGVKSLLKKKVITCEGSFEKPTLYLVTVGMSNYQNSSYNLKYAEKDANEISKIMQKNRTYKTVKTMNILNADFTKNVTKSLSSFLREAEINDVIIFYYAGHGVLDNQYNYYLATYNMDFDNPTGMGLAFDVLENLFEGLVCRNRLMMIDACFSGEIDKTSLQADTSQFEKKDDIKFRNTQLAAIDGNGDMGIFELSKRIFTDLRVSKGTNILSSSSGIEYALEGDIWGNGLFTYALKKGLIEGEADLNEDKQIRIMELQVYLRETVSVLSEGNQNPILRKENIKNNFVIW